MTIAEQIVAAIGPRREAKEMAEATYECLKRLAIEEEMSEEEVVFRRPGEDLYFGDTSLYCVAWEAGPDDWGYEASAAIVKSTGIYVQANHSFDICFYPEDRNAQPNGTCSSSSGPSGRAS